MIDLSVQMHIVAWHSQTVQPCSSICRPAPLGDAELGPRPIPISTPNVFLKNVVHAVKQSNQLVVQLSTKITTKRYKEHLRAARSKPCERCTAARCVKHFWCPLFPLYGPIWSAVPSHLLTCRAQCFFPIGFRSKFFVRFPQEMTPQANQ